MSTKLKFGDQPYDLAQGETGRYHVIDDKGFIRSKSRLGITAYDNAGNLSDREPGVFKVVDTKDGSIYGAYRGGEPVEENPAGGNGIKFVLGILKRGGKKVSEVQSVVFSKVSWTVDAAKQWLKDHGFKAPSPDAKAEHLRFRQKSPARYKEFSTIEAGHHAAKNPVGPYHGTVAQLKLVQAKGDRDGYLQDWHKAAYPPSSTRESMAFKKALKEMAGELGEMTRQDVANYKQVYYQGYRQGAYRGHQEDVKGHIQPRDNPSRGKIFPSLDDSPASNHQRMVHSLTQYDREQSGKRGHNIYALPQYLRAADEAKELMEHGKSPAEAINEVFEGRVGDRLHRDLATESHVEWQGPMPNPTRNGYYDEHGNWQLTPEERRKSIEDFGEQFFVAGGMFGTTIQSARSRVKKWRAEVMEGDLKHEKDLEYYLEAIKHYEWLKGGGRKYVGPSGRGRVRNPESGLVKVTADEVSDFRSSWPASGLPDGYDFYFDFQRGDLVDLWAQPEGTKYAPIGRNHKDTEQWDGPALVALSQDAQEGKRGGPVTMGKRNPESVTDSLATHTALTTDPGFQAAPPEVQAGIMTGMDLAESLTGGLAETLIPKVEGEVEGEVEIDDQGELHEDACEDGIDVEVEENPSISQAQEALRQKRLDGLVRTSDLGVTTWRDLVKRRIEAGGSVEKVDYEDEALRKKLQAEYDLMNRGFNVPWGNDRHPKTIAAQALKDRLAGKITSPQYRLTKAGEDWFIIINKTIYEYGLKLMGREENPSYGQVKGTGWIQEWYETSSGDARTRASEVRRLGYKVTVSSMGTQVTPVGTVKMTMVDIRPGRTGDEYLENVPEVKVERWTNPAPEGYYDLGENKETKPGYLPPPMPRNRYLVYAHKPHGQPGSEFRTFSSYHRTLGTAIAAGKRAMRKHPELVDFQIQDQSNASVVSFNRQGKESGTATYVSKAGRGWDQPTAHVMNPAEADRPFTEEIHGSLAAANKRVRELQAQGYDVVPPGRFRSKGEKPYWHIVIRPALARQNPEDRSILDAIRAGSRVTIVNRFGQERTGKAVMRGPHGWVLNMGGPHGTPDVATPESIVKVSGGKRNPEEAAAALSGEFHGRPAETELVHQSIGYPSKTAAQRAMRKLESKGGGPYKLSHSGRWWYVIGPKHNPEEATAIRSYLASKGFKRVPGASSDIDHWDHPTSRSTPSLLVRDSGSWTMWAGYPLLAKVITGDGLNEMKEAMSRYAKYPRTANPEEAAAALSEEFHGRPAETVTTVTEEIHEHEYLTELGLLRQMKVHTVTGLQVTLDFSEDDAPVLSSNETGTQLFIVGGDQSLPLDTLEMSGDKWQKESIVIGSLRETTYETRKQFDGFKTIQYYHRFADPKEKDGKDGKVPTLIYDRINKLLTISGGTYHVAAPGVLG